MEKNERKKCYVFFLVEKCGKGKVSPKSNQSVTSSQVDNPCLIVALKLLFQVFAVHLQLKSTLCLWIFLPFLFLLLPTWCSSFESSANISHIIID